MLCVLFFSCIDPLVRNVRGHPAEVQASSLAIDFEATSGWRA